MEKSTSAGGIVINKDGLVLVVQQKHDAWSLPKGKVEEGETLVEAAKREISEESGIDELKYILDLGEYERFRLNKYNKDDTTRLKRIVMFLFSTEQKNLSPRDPHNPSARWIKRDDVADILTHPKDKEFFLKVLPVLEKTYRQLKPG
jgi:8-oxo-dGTP pyrophosphatase MutT (NUDIX family)